MKLQNKSIRIETTAKLMHNDLTNNWSLGEECIVQVQTTLWFKPQSIYIYRFKPLNVQTSNNKRWNS